MVCPSVFPLVASNVRFCCVHTVWGIQLHYGKNEKRDPGMVQQASQQPASAPGRQASSRCTLDLGPNPALSSAPQAGAASKRDANAEQKRPNGTSHSTQAMRTTDTQAFFKKKRRSRVTSSGAGGVVNCLTSPKGCERQSQTPKQRARRRHKNTSRGREKRRAKREQ